MKATTTQTIGDVTSPAIDATIPIVEKTYSLLESANIPKSKPSGANIIAKKRIEMTPHTVEPTPSALPCDGAAALLMFGLYDTKRAPLLIHERNGFRCA